MKSKFLFRGSVLTEDQFEEEIKVPFCLFFTGEKLTGIVRCKRQEKKSGFGV